MSLTFADLFCGAGGSISGMVDAGLELILGANHWDRAIETVSANYPDADFLCADINHVDMLRLPRTDVLWASVICTEMSPAGGNRKLRGQQAMALEEYGHVPSAAYERTRACALDVIRATEVHRYAAVVVENVVEFARDWELYDWWVEGMCRLGYQAQVACADSAHISGPDNAPAPQWRGRIYVVFTRNGIRKPDLALRPTSWCSACDGLVEGRQVWKRTDRPRIGKYGHSGQYVYRCTRPGCDEVVEPLVLPAAAAIDQTDIGQRIGDRAKPLATATQARIRTGLEMFAQPVAGNTFERGDYRRVWPAGQSPLNTRTGTNTEALAVPDFLVNVNHPDFRGFPVDDGPLPTRTVKIGDALVRPFVTEQRRHSIPTPADGAPLATVTAGGNHHELTIPPGSFYMKNFTPRGRGTEMCKAVETEPLGSITTKDHHALVVPYRRGKAKPASEPLLTLGTRDSAGLCSVAVDIDDCYYRMLKPPEHFAAQRFRPDYRVKGNLGEQTMLAGNAVSVNAGHWIGAALLEVLG